MVRPLRSRRQRATGTLAHYPLGTRIRVHGRGGHPDWTGTVVPSSAGHITVRAGNGREVTFFPATLKQFATVVGRVDSGVAHHRPQLTNGRVRRYRLVAVNDTTHTRTAMSDDTLTHREAVTMKSKMVVRTKGPARHVRYLIEEAAGHSNRAEGRAAKYKAGSLNPWIWMGDKPIVRSRNLRGIREYAGKHVIRQISIARGAEGSGLISVFFDNGAEFHDKFASYSVLQTFLREGRNFQGAPFEVEGRDANVVMRDNPRLKNY